MENHANLEAPRQGDILVRGTAVQAVLADQSITGVILGISTVAGMHMLTSFGKLH